MLNTLVFLFFVYLQYWASYEWKTKKKSFFSKNWTHMPPRMREYELNSGYLNGGHTFRPRAFDWDLICPNRSSHSGRFFIRADSVKFLSPKWHICPPGCGNTNRIPDIFAACTHLGLGLSIETSFAQIGRVVFENTQHGGFWCPNFGLPPLCTGLYTGVQSKKQRVGHHLHTIAND